MALIGLISEKTLSISPSAKKTFTQGEIVNRCQVDAGRIHGIGGCLARVLCLPVMLTVSMVSLFKMIGPAFFAGLGIIGVSVIYNIFMARYISNIDKA